MNEKIFVAGMQKIFTSIFIVFAGIILYKISQVTIKKILTRNDNFIASRKYKTLSTLLNSIAKYLIVLFAACKIFCCFGVDIKSILTFAGIGGLTIGLGAQSLVKDFITGIFILFEDQFSVGDEVEIGDKSGVVEAITLRTTILKNPNGYIHIIPNSEIKIITNKSRN